MRTFLLLLPLFFLYNTAIAQDELPLGKWDFEKAPDHLGLEEKEAEMMNKFFKDFTVSFDENNFTLVMMGRTDSGTWTSNGKNSFTLNSSKGMEYPLIITKLSDTQIIFNIDGKEFQLIKSEEGPNIEIVENSIDKVEGIEIAKGKIIGTWMYTGSIKDGKEDGLILNHKKGEVVNYTFKKNNSFINRAPLGVVLDAKWSIGKNKKILTIITDETTEKLKVVKLTKNELHLFNPANESIITFTRK